MSSLSLNAIGRHGYKILGDEDVASFKNKFEKKGRPFVLALVTQPSGDAHFVSISSLNTGLGNISATDCTIQCLWNVRGSHLFEVFRDSDSRTLAEKLPQINRYVLACTHENIDVRIANIVAILREQKAEASDLEVWIKLLEKEFVRKMVHDTHCVCEEHNAALTQIFRNTQHHALRPCLLVSNRKSMQPSNVERFCENEVAMSELELNAKAHLYVREKKIEDAFSVISALLYSYPRNPFANMWFGMQLFFGRNGYTFEILQKHVSIRR